MNGPPTSQPDSPPPTGNADDPVHPGDVLSGKFRVERVLGVGGMGVVVAATHLQLGQLVALKFMLRQALQYPDNVARFEREARAAVRLRSDHVAKVTDVGRLDDGAPYMVMEFLEGEDLDRFARKNAPLLVQTAVDLLLQAAEAIAEAHSLGIVHRDLKPKNLFLTHRLNGEPLVKVLDFGVSKVIGGEGDFSLTATTQVLGSPSYMSPEQLRASRDVDQRTDIWALGAILYELLTGSVPFPATTLTQLTAMVISDPPRPIESLRQDVPTALRMVVLKCLEKRADDRYQSVADLAAALAPFASEISVALATQRMAGALGSSSNSRLNAPPDRPSFRAPGGSTDVAWDQTQLAPTDPKRSKVIPIAIAVSLASAILGAAVVLGVLHKNSAGPQSPSTPSATSAPPLPTVRDPISPPVVSGVERPPPISVVPTPTQTAAPIATHHVAGPVRHDAGPHAHPQSSSEGDLPSTRN
ncbi:MAG TPA: protein kinase [Polyangiaceae bacterium]|jgi:serine/threonine-protein kinase